MMVMIAAELSPPPPPPPALLGQAYLLVKVNPCQQLAEHVYTLSIKCTDLFQPKTGVVNITWAQKSYPANKVTPRPCHFNVWGHYT